MAAMVGNGKKYLAGEFLARNLGGAVPPRWLSLN